MLWFSMRRCCCSIIWDTAAIKQGAAWEMRNAATPSSRGATPDWMAPAASADSTCDEEPLKHFIEHASRVSFAGCVLEYLAKAVPAVRYAQTSCDVEHMLAGVPCQCCSVLCSQAS